MDNTGYCEKCGKPLAEVGLCGVCKYVENLITTTTERNYEIERLRGLLKECVERFHQYEMDVDAYP